MNLADAFRYSREKNPDKAALAWEESFWTYAEMDRVTDTLAGNLALAGMQCGDRIALHFRNGPELAFSYLAVLKAGGIAVPVNYRLKKPEVEYVLGHSGTLFYLGDADLFAKAGEMTLSPDRCFLSGEGTASGQHSSYHDLLTPLLQPIVRPRIHPAQIAAILYTSGTTAHPRGVMHSHETLLLCARAMHSLGVDGEQVVVIVTSMTHMIGFAMLLLPALLAGATVAIAPAGEAAPALETMERWRGTFTIGLPGLFHELAQCHRLAKRDLSSGRVFLCGGDSVTPALHELFEASVGQPVQEAYGATEISPITWTQPGTGRIGSMGQGVNDVEIRVLDDGGEEVRIGELGEICVRSPRLTPGYWQDPEATNSTIRAGWFYTGDLARRDADGFFWFEGRKKEIIVRGGSNVSPQEVEAAICEHPLVAQAAVIGRPDEVQGQTVEAWVVLRSSQVLAEADLIAFVRTRIADYKTPDRIVYTSALPYSATGKVHRRTLRETPAGATSWYDLQVRSSAAHLNQ